MSEIHRGDIYFADLTPNLGSEQGGLRPVLIVQNDVGNRFSPTVIAAAITGSTKKTLPTHVRICGSVAGLHTGSTILLEQVRTLDKQRLGERIGALAAEDMRRVDQALGVSLGI